MPAQKKPAAAPDASTRCEQGQEMLPFAIGVPAFTQVDLQILICQSVARVRVWLDDVLQLDEVGIDGVSYRSPRLAPGTHLLFWSVLPATATWQTRDEVSVSGAVRFRRKKSSSGNNPINAGFIHLEVA
jgi:hypothetical protein